MSEISRGKQPHKKETQRTLPGKSENRKIKPRFSKQKKSLFKRTQIIKVRATREKRQGARERRGYRGVLCPCLLRKRFPSGLLWAEPSRSQVFQKQPKHFQPGGPRALPCPGTQGPFHGGQLPLSCIAAFTGGGVHSHEQKIAPHHIIPQSREVKTGKEKRGGGEGERRREERGKGKRNERHGQRENGQLIFSTKTTAGR